MVQFSETQFYEQLCIPTIKKLLKETFVPDNTNADFSAKNTSLNFSEGQLKSFAEDILASDLMYDIQNLANNDPAASKHSNKEKYVWDSYKGMKAVMYYRIAHHLMDFENNCLMPSKSSYFADEEDDQLIRDYMVLQARVISEKAAKETTIEINPSAQIGKGFVIDHGIGTKVAPGIPNFSTVIGETCTIGENCTLLNSVLLGAQVINQASTPNEGVSTGKRHPTLGNGVTVCAGVRILGDIKVGNNVLIGPCCVITNNIPDNYVITVINQLQYSRQKKDSVEEHSKKDQIEFLENINYIYPVIEGLTINDKGKLLLFGDRIAACKLSVVSLDDGKEYEISSLHIVVENITQTSVEFCLQSENMSDLYIIKNLSLRIDFVGQEYPDCEFILERPYALKQYIEAMKSKKSTNEEKK